MSPRKRATEITRPAPSRNESVPPQAVPSAGDFLFSPEFEQLTLDEVCELPVSTSLYADRHAESFADLSAYGLDAVGSMPVLSPAGERFLFRKMNFLKYLAWRKSSGEGSHERSPDEPSAAELREDADAVRRHLAECNLRLVAAVARQFSTDQRDFDELVSEGNLILLKAVDRFDYSRGFRFSTYLTHSVRRHLYRLTATKSKRRSKEIAAPAEMLEAGRSASPETVEENPLPIHQAEELVRRMNECLTEREQWVVRKRFGLGDGSGLAFREIAKEAGLSKERIRQIQIAALGKLKDLLQRLEGEPAEAAPA